MYIPRDICGDDLPLIPYCFTQKGVFELDDAQCRMFVKERVVPPNRQNIGQIMRVVGMTYYNEFQLLEYVSGRCCMDDFI